MLEGKRIQKTRKKQESHHQPTSRERVLYHLNPKSMKQGVLRKGIPFQPTS